MKQEISYSQQSRILNAMRFPLACMVVVVHCKINKSEWVLPGWTNLTGNVFCAAFQNFFSNILCDVAVPVFFLMSGYFFFYKTEGFTSQIYISKLKKRARTLLLPYLLWNVLYVAYIVMVKLAACLIKGKPYEGIWEFFEEHGWIRMLWITPPIHFRY